MIQSVLSYYFLINYFIIGVLYFPFFLIRYISFLRKEFQEKLSELFILQVIKIYRYTFGLINSFFLFIVLSPLFLVGGVYILYHLIINYKTIKQLKNESK